MPDATLNTTANGWPYLDDQNYIDITDDYSLTLANKLETDVTQLSQDAAAAAAAANALAGTFLIGTGRPDVPATTPYTATQLNAAAVGTEYRSTDGPQGAWRWRKTGATTWTVTDGDTGWRKIPLANGWAGDVYLYRNATLAKLLFQGLTPAAATSTTALQLVAGYSPVSPVGTAMERPLLYTTTPAFRRFTLTHLGLAVIGSVPDAAVLYGDHSWIPAPGWPAALPGTGV